MSKKQALFVFLFSLLPFQLSFADIRNLPIKGIKSPTFSQTDLSWIQKSLSLELGSKLNLDRIESGIRKLYSNGKIHSILIEYEETKEGVHLTILGEKFRAIQSVQFVPDNLDVVTEVLEEFGGIKGFEDLVQSDRQTILRLRERLQSAFEFRGYYRSRIEIKYTETSHEDAVPLVISVYKGEPTRVVEIKISGGSREENLHLISQVPLKRNALFTKPLLEESLETIRKHLRNNQYIASKILDTELDFNEDKSLVNVSIVVQLGERVQFEFQGNTVFEEFELRGRLTQDLTSQSDAPQRLKDLIEKDYKKLGYYFCHVKHEVEKRISDKLEIHRFTIDEGHKVKIDRVLFTGDIRPRMNSRTLQNMFFDTAPLVLSRGLYWEDGLIEATQNLKTSLEQSGFLSVTLSHPRTEITDDRKGVILYYEIDLGDKTLIKVVHFRGQTPISEHELRASLTPVIHPHYNPEEIKQGEDILKKLFKKYGYLDAVVKSKVEIEHNQASITFEIELGNKYLVGLIRIEGNKKTKEHVILREMKLKTGDVFNPELITRSEDDIALLGLFSRVEMLTSRSTSKSNEMDIHIVVKENAPGIGELGIGAVYEDPRFRPRIFGGIGYRNLHGLGHSASMRGEFSLPFSEGKLIPFVEYSALILYRAPYPLELPFTFQTQVSLDQFEVNPDGPKVQTRARLEERIEKKLSTQLTGIFRLHRLERSVIENVNKAQNEPIESEVIGSLGPGLVLDNRDNPFNPTRGSFHIVDFELAHPSLLSQNDISFIMGLSRNSFYFPLVARLGLATYVGLGYAKSLLGGKPIPAARILNELSLGGRSSIRGFSVRAFSPPLQTESTAFYNVRFELSIPFFSDDWVLAVFFDSGQIFPDFNYQARHDGVGIGARYKTPVGPVAIDIAQGIGPDKEQLKFYFRIGTI